MYSACAGNGLEKLGGFIVLIIVKAQGEPKLGYELRSFQSFVDQFPCFQLSLGHMAFDQNAGTMVVFTDLFDSGPKFPGFFGRRVIIPAQLNTHMVAAKFDLE